MTVEPLHSHISDFSEYKELYHQSITNPSEFFGKLAKESIDWIRPFDNVQQGSFEHGDVSWFTNGQLNVSFNCVDRHALATPSKVAIIAEADEPGNHKHITYKELLHQVCKFANVLKKFGVKKGDRVCIYMPMIPEAAYAMLACARIGAIHSVVFAGFSADALRSRIVDAHCAVVVTADFLYRGGKVIELKKIVDEAISTVSVVRHVILLERKESSRSSQPSGLYVSWTTEMEQQRPYCPVEPMDSEDPLFMLYTSGSTGTPKGVVHTQAGYLLGATLTCKYVFDLRPGDVFGCMADVGWITGHTYIVYGPLSNGTTTVMFESVPTYPTPSRYWQMVDTHKITQFYTAPTAIRALRRLGNEHVEKHSLSSLRVLGSVGEPINPEAWTWYHDVVGRSKCAVVDTYWQTETGSIIITPLPGIIPLKPGSATLPFFGIAPVLLDSTSGSELRGSEVEGVLAVRSTWPSMARTVYNNHERYLSTYMNHYPGYYFTGDSARRDTDGYIWIGGRVDDVINVSGHRLSTAEIESALILNPSCSESAVVGIHDDLTGQAIVCFCTLKKAEDEALITKSLIMEVRKHIGPFATPKKIHIVSDLPKTRSGKIMRRILRKVAGHEVTLEDAKNEHKLLEKLGDLTTLADPSVIYALLEKVGQ